MNNVYIYILVMALTTYLIRMLPLVCFKKKITNKFFKSFLYYVPYACLTAMTFPAILYTTDNIISGVIGLAVGIYFAYKGKSMVKVAIYACIAVFIVEKIITLFF